MDRKAWIAVILSGLGMIGWYWYVGKHLPPPPPAPPAVTAAATPASPAVATVVPSVQTVVTDGEKLTSETKSLYTTSAEYIFENNVGGIEQVMLYRHQGELSQNIILNEKSAGAIGALELEAGTALGGFTMQADGQTGEVVFRKVTKDGVEITKRFQVPPARGKEEQYVLTMELSFKNTGKSDVSFPAYFISAGKAAPVHTTDLPMYTRFDWMRENKMTDINVLSFNASAIPLIGIQLHPEKTVITEAGNKISWAAVSSQYFCTIVNAPDSNATNVWATRYTVGTQNNKPIYGIDGAMGFSAFKLAAGQTSVQQLTIYAGPKDYAILKKLGNDQQAIMKFGWFKVVSVFLLWAMNKLYALLGSYALAIIVLTLCIKIAMWPLQNKATESMKRMSLLSPKMTELREKYKDDPTKMNEELMKLYREYNVNPFGGCLPMLIQIPIFFGFYSMLGTAIQLRGSSFLWVKDLSLPDTVFHVAGFPVNILPIIMALTMLIQMSMTPKSGDAAQQRFMFFMPVIFVVFCYNYASGLALYWTTQNIFSIVQLYFTRNRAAPQLQKKSDLVRKVAGEAKKKRRK